MRTFFLSEVAILTAILPLPQPRSRILVRRRSLETFQAASTIRSVSGREISTRSFMASGKPKNSSLPIM